MSNPEQYNNQHGKSCYRCVTERTPISELQFTEADQYESDVQVYLHTNIGTLTILDRMTGYGCGIRDTESGYRDPVGLFWLASGNNDVRKSGSLTVGEAIEWVKSRANTCIGV